MADIRICGGRRLQGELSVQGSKNAVLPILAATVLFPGITALTNVPRISDVSASLDIIRHLGGTASWENDELIIDSTHIKPREIPRKLGERMRSSILFLGALVGRFGEADLYSPGGCSIGSRPIDLHLMGLEKLGAEICVEECPSGSRIHACAKVLQPAEITFSCPSVGATEQMLLTASAVDGITVLKGCAREPEIGILCHFLMCFEGVRIGGIGSDTLVIHGSSRDNALSGLFVCRDSGCNSVTGGCPKPSTRNFVIPGDRIAAGTYLAAAAITGGDVTVTGICSSHLREELSAFHRMGCFLDIRSDSIRLKSSRRLRAIPVLETKPFPGFSTDMQSVFLTLNSVAQGKGVISETIFESRLKIADELNRMGADIRITGNQAAFVGVERLQGCHVCGTDLRSTAALILAALSAKGESHISGYDYVRRGYEDFIGSLKRLGAEIEYELQQEGI